MLSKNKINNYIEKLNDISDTFNLEFETEMIQIRFMSEVERLMEENEITKTKLAKKIGTSPSFITQLFQGNKKLNLETIAKLQHALNYKFRVDAVKDVTRPLSYLGYGDFETPVLSLFNYDKPIKRKANIEQKQSYQLVG